MTDHQSRKIEVLPGTWQVEEPLITPEGYSFHAGPGTTIDLVSSALLLVRGPLVWEGTPAAPIHIHSSDDTGQGLVVMHTEQTSRLKHVAFENLSSVDQHAWRLTGGCDIYEAPVELGHASFASNRSEDALNIVRTSFSMDSVRFHNTYSDAFDADFTTGRISNSSFVDCTNDGIDISGSELAIDTY